MAHTRDTLNALIAERIATDSSFRDALMADPHATLTELTGMPIPEAIAITVHEESPADIHLVIPAAALTETDLELVAGGWDGSNLQTCLTGVWCAIP